MTLVAQLRPRPTLTRRSACLPSIPDADYWMVWVSFAKLQLSADAEAVTWLRRGLESNHNYPNGHFALAAAQALLGSQSEARAAAQAGLALNPTFKCAAIALAYRVTTRFTSPAASAFVRGCASPECQRGDDRFGVIS